MRLRRALAVVALSLVWALLPGLRSAPVAAYPTANVEFSGHGWGHGRGMGQYGAYGYAQMGWSTEQILNHYYSNTHTAVVDDNSGIDVQLTAFNGGGDLIVFDPAGAVVSGTGAAKAFIVRRVGGNIFDVFSGPDCDGPWTLVRDNAGGPITVTPQGGDGVSPVIHVCVSGGTKPYRGSLLAYDSAGGKVANLTRLNWYLRGIAEMPSSWDAAALRAQAVAARSYAAARGLGDAGFPDICDSTACQVYSGVQAETASRVAAVNDTAGQVRRFNHNNVIASTEYSSSTGGRTAGGDFPSVPDDGDAISANPNHDWTASIPVSEIQSRWPSIGTLQAVNITERTPEDGYVRAKTVVLSGSAGQVSVSANDFRSIFAWSRSSRPNGIRSTWFAVTGVPSGGVDGYWILGDDGGIFTFGKAGFHGSTGGKPLNQPVVGMAGTPSGNGYWLVARDGGIFTFGDAPFHGSTGSLRLNQPIVGMASLPGGNGYWLVASDGGIFSFGNAQFHGSTGSLKLNQPIVGMAASPTGNGYWLVASDGGIFSFGDALFHGSTGSLKLARPVVGMASTKSGNGYWLAAADGGLFAFGDADYHGSVPGRNLRATVVQMQRTFDGNGYAMVTDTGYVHSFGDAPVFGGVRDQVPWWTGRALGLTLHAGS